MNGFAAVAGSYRDSTVSTQFAAALQPINTIGLEQTCYPGGELGDDTVLAGNHLWHIKTYFTHQNAEISEVIACLVVQLSGFEQRLGWNTAHVETGAAERRFVLLIDPLLDARCLQSQLGSTNSGHVARRATADYNHFVRVRHQPFRASWTRIILTEERLKGSVGSGQSLMPSTAQTLSTNLTVARTTSDSPITSSSRRLTTSR